MWTDRELKLVKEYFKREGVRGLLLRGVKKTSIDIVEKALELGFELNVATINLSSKEEYSFFIRRGYIVPKGWDKKSLDILLNYYPIGGYKLCKERGLTNKTDYSVRKLVSYVGLLNYREKEWSGINILNLLDIYDAYGIDKCYETYPNIDKESMAFKIKQYRYNVK